MASLRVLQCAWLSILVWAYLGSLVTANWGDMARAWLQPDNEVGQHAPRRVAISEVTDYSQLAFREAERALTSLEEARICKREVTLKLISSSTCKDMLKETRREEIEIIQELYAVQLAKCEIESASAMLPQACQMDLTSFSFEGGPRAALQSRITSCLATLHSKPQWWTSYSNHRRDGYDWCLIMKPGFDYNEHTRVWKGIYSAIDVSAQAIKESLHGILSWSHESKASLHEFGDFLANMMNSMHFTSEKQFNDLEMMFHGASQRVQDRMVALDHPMTEIETKLKDIEQLSEANKIVINRINQETHSIAIAQKSHLDQAAALHGDLMAIQIAVAQGHDNIALQQEIIMDKFVSMLDAIDGLGQSVLDASDHLQSLNGLLTTFTGFSSFLKLMKWSIPVVLVAYFSRVYALLLFLFILCCQEIASHFQGRDFTALDSLIQSIYTITKLQHHLRLLCILAIAWFLAANRSKVFANQNHSNDAHDQEKQLQKHIANEEQLTLHISPSFRGHTSPLPYYNRRFEREGSSPL